MSARPSMLAEIYAMARQHVHEMRRYLKMCGNAYITWYTIQHRAAIRTAWKHRRALRVAH